MSKSIIKQKRILTKAGGGSSLATPVSVANGGTGISSYAIGDIIYASGATTLSKLPIGTASQQLRVNAGATALEYFTPASGGITVGTTTITSGTSGRIPVNISGVYTEMMGIGLQGNSLIIDPKKTATTGTGYWANWASYGNLVIGSGTMGAGSSVSYPYGITVIGTGAGTSLISGGASSEITIVGHQACTGTVGSYVTAIGNATSAGFNSVLVLGKSATATAANQCVIGAAAATSGEGVYNNLYFNGVTYTSAAPIVINACGGSGTNNAGANITIAGGKGTGSAAGGNYIVSTSTTLGSGTTLQTLVPRLTISGGAVTTDASTATWADALDFVLGSTTGTKIGTATTQKLAFWNATPIVQPTTAYAAATLVGGAGTNITDTDTFDGYTLKQIVAALRGIGLLA